MTFFSRLIHNTKQVFSMKNLPWHLLAILLTYILVASGFDWYYFMHTRSQELRAILFPAVLLGSFVPIFLPITLLVIGHWRKNAISLRAVWVLVQAEIIADMLSFFYKTFTGRMGPHFADVGTDISHMFRFGFMRGGYSGAGHHPMQPLPLLLPPRS